MTSRRSARYMRNGDCITEDEQQLLSRARVCVLGCGGLGGYIIEMLARAGFGYLKVVDGDVFDESNLNRQILSNPDNLGRNKALAAGLHVQAINSEINCVPIPEYISADNVQAHIGDCDIVMDALDDMAVRKIVAGACQEMGKVYIYGAIAGWYGQVATIHSGDVTYPLLFDYHQRRGEEVRLGNPSFTPAVVAGIEVSECVKTILNKGKSLRNSMISIDLLNNEVETIKIEV